jgi:L-fucose isomerase-like protein
VSAGLPQPTCLRIAQRFKKPVILALAAGWGLDAPAGIRNLGLEGYYAADWPELSRLLRILVARKAFRETRILRVTNFPGRLPSGVASAIPDLDLLTKRYGIQHETLDYERFFGDMDVFVNRPANREAARALASQLVGAAASSTMSLDEVSNSMLFHLYVDDTMSRLRANAFTIECFELCSSLNPWKRHFTPCASHALRKDAGMPSACEGDVNALLAMAAEMYLSRKSVYMGNPDIDVQASTVKLHHSDAGRRPRGIDGADARYEIDAFAKAGFGATLRYDFAADKGETVTLGRFAPCGTKMLVTSGPIVGGGGLDGIGCAQNVEVRVPDGRDLLRQMANFGHHLALVYGDYVADLRDLGDMLGFEVVRV